MIDAKPVLVALFVISTAHAKIPPLARDGATIATDTVSVTIDDAHWIEAGAAGRLMGAHHVTFHPKAGDADTMVHSHFADAATGIDGGWRYVVDHASVVT